MTVSHRTLKPRKPIAREAEEQKALIKWAKFKNIPLVHIPNEGQRRPQYGVQLQRLGLCRGFPDLFLPKGFGGFFGMFIEMKQNREYRESEKKADCWINQEAWLEKLLQESYYAKFAFGCDHAIELIEMYTKWKPTKEFYGKERAL